MTKRKQEAKKEKRVEIWKTEGVSHIPTRQTKNNNYYLSLETKTLHCPAKPLHLKVTSDDIVQNNFSVEGDGFFKGSDTATMFFDGENPELYFLGSSLPDDLNEDNTRAIDEQRIIFNENLDKINTAELNIEEQFYDGNPPILDFIDLNKPLTYDMLLKLESLAK